MKERSHRASTSSTFEAVGAAYGEAVESRSFTLHDLASQPVATKEGNVKLEEVAAIEVTCKCLPDRCGPEAGTGSEVDTDRSDSN